jgi:alpha-N-acetylglucosamine transferase
MMNLSIKNAYGTFIFKDGGYLPGLLMVAYRLRKLGTKAKIICCYTEDIPKKVIDTLSLFYDELILVDYLKVGRKRTGRQAPLPWMFTRFRLLGLNNIEKLIILDADMLPINSFDPLFELDSPAGVINESKDKVIGCLKTNQKIESWEWHEHYGLIAPPPISYT